MIGHWCGKSFGVFAVALSAGALAGCSPHSYELGKADGGAGGSGATGGASHGGGGTTVVPRGGSFNNGGMGDEGGESNGQGGSAIAHGGSSTVGSGGTSAGGSVAAGGTAGSAGSIEVTTPLLQELVPSPTKLDLLFMVDNSIGMADKQAALAAALPGFLQRFGECRDADGALSGFFDCASGFKTEFGRLADIHVGIITSSLGDHGSGDVCSQAQADYNVQMGGPATNYNDLAQLLPSVRDDLDTGSDQDFLVWPPSGEQQAADWGDYVKRAGGGVKAAGDLGCGYESQLESWYRFLIDPEPVESMTHTTDTALNVRGPLNNVVLQQRAAFLRPDSVLAIVMITDENDCSVADEDNNQGWLVGYKGGVNQQALWHMPRATAACATSPNDPSCHPCMPDDSDPECAKGVTLPTVEDSMNLRCFHQMQRFGVDLLYPTSRYVEALTSPLIHPRVGGPEAPNPLFQAFDGARVRSPEQVVLAGIVGVPWQDVSTEDSWTSDGLEFLSADELASKSRWDALLGGPAGIDPFMIESIDMRAPGTQHPFLPDVRIENADAAADANPINGHEQVALNIRDDLQFACTYPLPKPVPCTDPDADRCDCNWDEFDRHSPLCEGTTATKDGTQVYGKAYPSIRELEVLKGVGANAVVTSACPKYAASGADTESQGHGYEPALRAVGDRLVRSFNVPCLPHSLPIEQCAVVEARPSDGNDCDLPGRAVPDGFGADLAQRAEQQLGQQGYDTQSYTFCQIQALEGSELDACQNTQTNPPGAGYCYIDADLGIGNASIIASCPDSMKHVIRIVGEAPPPDVRTFVACADLR